MTTANEDITIERLVAGGDGLGRLSDGRIVFVPAVAPGDVVAVELTSSKRDLARGVVTRVLTPGTDRVDPPCARVAAGCGGCDWQHLSPVGQRAAKVTVVADAFNRIGRLPEIAARIRFSDGIGFRHESSDGGAELTGWRTTVRASVNRSGRAGFFRAGTHEVVPTGPCMVAHPVIAQVLGTGTFAPDDEITVRVGVSSKQLVVGASKPAAVKLPALPAGWSAEVVKTPSSGGTGTVTERIDGVDLRVSIGSFFQSGPEAASILVRTVTELLSAYGQPDVFLDLYGGVGLFAATVGRTARETVVVESATSSVSDARFNLGEAALVHRSLVEEWDPPRVVRRATNLHAVADPARAGLGRDGVAAVVKARPAAFVLVSCDAPAGARDARMLIDDGFVLHEVRVLDLFPHTSHMETVMLFTPGDGQPGDES